MHEYFRQSAVRHAAGIQQQGEGMHGKVVLKAQASEDKIGTREEGVASVELSKDAGQAPHVNGGGVAQAQHDLGGAVEAALDVAVHLLPLKATAAKVNHLSNSTRACEKGHTHGGLITAIRKQMKSDKAGKCWL